MIPYLSSSRPTLVPRAKIAQVARERDLQAGAERVAAHRGDRRERRRLEPRVRLLRAQHHVDHRVRVAGAGVRHVEPGAGREHGRVDAARERAALPDHDQRAEVTRIGDELLAERAELVPHLGGEAVELVGPVEHEPSDVAISFEAKCVHGSNATASAARIGPGDPGQPDDRDRRAEPRDLLRPDGQRRDLRRAARRATSAVAEHLERLGQIAEPRREVHRAAGVVVALEQDDPPPREPGAHREQTVVGEPLLQLDHRAHERRAFDRDQHRAVAQPLRDAHADVRRDRPHRVAELREHRDRLVVTVEIGEPGEAGEVDEGKGPRDTHGHSLARDHAPMGVELPPDSRRASSPSGRCSRASSTATGSWSCARSKACRATWRSGPPTPPILSALGIVKHLGVGRARLVAARGCSARSTRCRGPTADPDADLRIEHDETVDERHRLLPAEWEAADAIWADARRSTTTVRAPRRARSASAGS